MRRHACLSCLIAVALAARPADAQDGRLSSLRDDVNRPASSSVPPSSADNNDGFLSSFLSGLFCSEDGSPSLGLRLTGIAALSPFYIPAMLLKDGYDHRLYFLPHPYANGFPIYQIADPQVAKDLYQTDTEQVPRNNWAVRLAVENGNDFAGINRLNGQVKIEHASRWGVNSNWNWYVERLPCGCLDETLIGDTNVTFRFAQHEMGSMYTGLGVRILTDPHQTDFGFNFTYGGDWFPVRPIVVSGVVDAGTLGNAGAVHGRATVGAIWQGWEVYTGYDFLRIGRVNLQGPMIGLRFWF